jgi:death-on-curing protein
MTRPPEPEAHPQTSVLSDLEGALLPSAEGIILLHEMQHARFGGGSGVRDLSLLEGAAGRGLMRLLYEDEEDLVGAICAIGEGVIRSHPMVDGNKRAGFAVITVGLALNGLCLEMNPREAARTIVDFAAGSLSSEEFRDRIRAHVGARPSSVTAPTPESP